MRGSWATPACLLLTAVLGRAGDGPDLQGRRQAGPREPAYTSRRPLYGLLVFGPEAKARVWMVLDRSKPDAGPYDVLYADLDADGDLTEPAERVAGQVEGNTVASACRTSRTRRAGRSTRISQLGLRVAPTRPSW